MKRILGFQCLNEAPWLRLHLPIMLEAGWDAVVFVDGGSTDGSPDVIFEVLQSHDPDGQIDVRDTFRRWDWDFAAQQNAVIALAEQVDTDGLFLKWDPDELLFPEHIWQALDLLERGPKALKIPRWNFEGDRLHYCPYMYPDYQVRFWRLDEGFRWRGKLHAGLDVWEKYKENGNPSGPHTPRPVLQVPHIAVFHYEGLRPIEERYLKWQNYDRIAKDLEPWTELPPDVSLPDPNVRVTVTWDGEQPLNPIECGARAPYE